MYINTFRHTRESVDCRYCMHYRQVGKSCRLPICPYTKERVEANAVNYSEIMRRLCKEFPTLQPRLMLLSVLFRGSMWENLEHRKRMDWLKISCGYNHARNTPAYYAAMYLLTADKDLYRRTRNCFNRQNIDFCAAQIRGISEKGYILLMAAKCIYQQEEKLTLEDMQTPEIVDDASFRIIVNAHLVARYGLNILRLRKA